MDDRKSKLGKWLPPSIIWTLIVANTISLAAFHWPGTRPARALRATRRLVDPSNGAVVQSKPLTQNGSEGLPSGLQFSRPVRGLAIALQPPKPIPASRLRWHPFPVWIANLGDSDVAFSRHMLLLELAVYDSRGRLLTHLKNYGYDACTMKPGLGDLVILGPGEMIRTETCPLSIDFESLRRGSYRMEAILEAPPAHWWFSIRHPWSLEKELHSNGIAVWGPAKVVSPRQPIELM
jgi:hypothetical protein